MENGTETVLPVSARDIHYVESESIAGLFYGLKPLSYHGKTQINALMFREGIRGVLPDEFRQKLREVIEILHLDSQVYVEVLRILDALDTGDEVSEADQQYLRTIEEQARRVDKEYAGLWADQYEHTRMYNWLLVKHVLLGIYSRDTDGEFLPYTGSPGLAWTVDSHNRPTDHMLDQIQDDIPLLALESGRMATLSETAEKNSDLPSE